MKISHLMQPLIAIVVVSWFIISFTASPVVASYELIPRISVSEEYTDNINEAVVGKQEEFITRARPGFFLKYHSPNLTVNTNYSFDYRYYAKGRKGDEYTHNLDAAGTLTLLENFLYLDASDTYRRVSLDVTRDNTYESLYRSQSDQNIGKVSPYILWRYRGDSFIKTGYSYVNTWYREPSGIDKREHGAFLDVSHEITSGFALTCGYSYANANTSLEKYQRHNAYGGFRYEYANKSFLFGQLGNTWQSYDNGTRVNNLFWSSGLTHDFNFAVATAETRVQYTEDPLRSAVKETLYAANLKKDLARGNVNASVSYSEFEIINTGATDRRKFAISADGKYELIERLTASLGVIGERYSKKIVSDYPYRFIGNAGLSYTFNNNVSLALNYSYITNRYAIDESAGSKNINRIVTEMTITF